MSEAKKKKICIFSAQYLPHMGGVERYTYYLAKEMIARGHEVVVVTSELEGEKEHLLPEENENIEVFRLPSYNLVDGRLPILKKSKTLKITRTILEEKKFDFVLVNTRFYFLSAYGVRFARKNGIKCGVVEHGTTHLTFNNKILDLFERMYEHGITFIVKQNCSDFYGVSRACCKWSAHFGIESKGVLYNSIDIDEMESYLEQPVKDYRKDFHISENAIVITFTGRMIPEKGIYELIDAAFLLDTDREIVVFMAGDGPELEKVRKKVSSNKKDNLRIIPLGRIDYPHICALLGQSDIYCLPSVSEGFPTSVLEAIAAKCFVITTRTGGAREVIANGESGIIIADNESAKVKEALQKAINNNEFRETASQKAYDTLKSSFTWSNTADKLESIIS